jgi:uncharacterized coiled-coil DUF342 family protein
MSKRATLAEKLLHRLNAKIDALVAAREELLEEIEEMRVAKTTTNTTAAK